MERDQPYDPYVGSNSSGQNAGTNRAAAIQSQIDGE